MRIQSSPPMDPRRGTIQVDEEVTVEDSRSVEVKNGGEILIEGSGTVSDGASIFANRGTVTLKGHSKIGDGTIIRAIGRGSGVTFLEGGTTKMRDTKITVEPASSIFGEFVGRCDKVVSGLLGGIKKLYEIVVKNTRTRVAPCEKPPSMK